MPFLAEETFKVPNKDLLSWIFDEQKHDVDKPIYIDAADPSQSISSRQALSMIRKLIAGFRAHGVKPGDCICVHSFNSIYYPLIFLAIVGCGGVFAGTNPSYTPFELVHHFKTARVTFVITEPEMLKEVNSATKEIGLPSSKILIFDTLKQDIPSGFSSWTSLLTHGEEDWIRFDDELLSKKTTVARLFSSGTTGLPKAAVLSHHNFVAQHTLAHEAHPAIFQIVRLCYLPMYHAAMVPLTHVSPLRAYFPTYIMRRFELEPFLYNISTHKISEIIVVPPVALAIIKSPATTKYSFSALKWVGCGAAPLARESQLALQGVLGSQSIVVQGWGMTETCCVATRFDLPEEDDTGSVGRPLPNLDIKLIDDDDRDITAYDTRGELCIRGPTIISGYFENPEANANSFTDDGYFRTGDIMYCAASSKKWYIVDRKKELIKIRGFQVAPGEIEAVLLSHPQVLDAAVIGIQMPPALDENEHPRAYVVVRPGTDGQAVNEATLRSYCGSRLAKFKDLTGGICFIDVMPRNPTGKILKRILRDMAKAELGAGGPKI